MASLCSWGLGFYSSLTLKPKPSRGVPVKALVRSSRVHGPALQGIRGVTA